MEDQLNVALGNIIMKITIDTKEDSPDEIKRIIETLNALISASAQEQPSEVLQNVLTNAEPVAGLPLPSQPEATTEVVIAKAAHEPKQTEDEPIFSTVFETYDSDQEELEKLTKKKEQETSLDQDSAVFNVEKFFD